MTAPTLDTDWSIHRSIHHFRLRCSPCPILWVGSTRLCRTLALQAFLSSGSTLIQVDTDGINFRLTLSHTLGKIVAAMLIDLSKAFDWLPHRFLLAKLSAYGLSNDSCNLLMSYLSERKRVKIGNSRSSWSEIIKGVPQGSILGPLLFNIFINNIFMPLKMCIIMQMIMSCLAQVILYMR